MSTELMEALTILEQEKDISKETMLDAIENSLMNACKNHFKKADNIKIVMNWRLVISQFMRRRPLWRKLTIQTSRLAL